MLKKQQTLFSIQYCLLCQQALQLPDKQSPFFCHACSLGLPWHQQACFCCGNAFPITEQQLLCGQCLLHPPAYQRLIATWYYHSPVREIIATLKFKQDFRYLAALSQYLLTTIMNSYSHDLPSRIIPVPLHKRRLRQRGFNQAQLIAKKIAKRLQLPLDIHSCERIRATKAQADLPSDKRNKNVRKAFQCKADLHGETVAIVDDIVTTGNTVTELAHCLHQAGAHAIHIWCCAKT